LEFCSAGCTLPLGSAEPTTRPNGGKAGCGGFQHGCRRGIGTDLLDIQILWFFVLNLPGFLKSAPKTVKNWTIQDLIIVTAMRRNLISALADYHRM
jgi:hypothetical protein